MTIGMIGRKVGMTRVAEESGKVVPVTVVHLPENVVTQVKTAERDGYEAIQVGVGSVRPQRLTGAMAGHFRKAAVEPRRFLREFRLNESGSYQAGQELSIEMFNVGQRIDVTGISKGKGFAGAIKRHNFRSNRASHGNSLSHRAPGSIGCRQTPGRVFKGKKMAGQLGNERITTLNLEIVRVDVERRLVMVKGSVPGANDGHVLLRPTRRG
ncbi:50S ribosomal protein L3 [Candidatus Igneacidithiobacillus taiwanensis]|uniref:50S ribosomal protein L3 n=1 Tax=Candidatus Igneacidithiobacillus taiwanensis TaxID=1945924 RepID=UPI0028A1ADBD|nr:50S ribosomal protein L3 [Candidatus Igneacidithiobacillus taiwanensis]MCE5360463.1 50S ribosomal protein L3 [Acidithiobacillus sp.]